MKKLKRIISLAILLSVILVNCIALAAEINTNVITKAEYTDEFEKWLGLSVEEQNEVLLPRILTVPKTSYQTKNPVNIAHTVGSDSSNKFTLQDYIPNNLKIKNQASTQLCWAFSALSALETNLALSNYYQGNTSEVYDYSEIHMAYATSREFKNGQINPMGFKKAASDAGNYIISRAYLTNGSGAVKESDMPFTESLTNNVSLDDIKNKEVITQVYDTIVFPAYDKETDNVEEIKTKMKDALKKYGAIEAQIFGANLMSDYYNNDTGALYCDDEDKCPLNHGITIVGWDDSYPKENFLETHRPKNNGAWIVRNSWGTALEISMTEMKAQIFNTFRDECISKGWNSATAIPDSEAKRIFETNGYEIEDDHALLKIGDDGFMYLSYEDVNIYKNLSAIEKATDSKNYDNIYQHDIYGYNNGISLKVGTSYWASIFERDDSKKEYLSEVSLYTLETVECKVYVNPNGDSKKTEDLIEVELKEGETETFSAGYHTLELLNPVELTGKKFVVVVEVKGTRSDGLLVPLETEMPNTILDYVKVENQKTFVSYDEFFEKNEWLDCGEFSTTIGSSLPNGDLTIKAFTIGEVAETDLLSSIEITTPPTKTKYEAGDDFDKTGMVVTAKYSDGKTEVVTDYTIKDGTELEEGQTDVTIEYKGKTVKQSITVTAGDTPTTVEAKNSDFSDAVSNVKSVKRYTYTDKNKKEYSIINLTIEDVTRYTSKNDSYEYYYYVSSSSAENNIKNWVKITEKQTKDDELTFSIDTRNLSNYAEVLKSNNLYLYIKEVAKKEDSSKIVITNSILVETEKNVTVYVDDKEKTTDDDKNTNNANTNNTNTNTNQNTNTNTNPNTNKDDTTANTILPAAGTMSLIATMIVITIFGLIVYSRYRNMDF